MPCECVKFCLFIVTADGWYNALTNAPAHGRVCDIVKLEELIQKIRPGHGEHYLTHVTKCSEKSVPLEKEYLVLERYSETLRKRAATREQLRAI